MTSLRLSLVVAKVTRARQPGFVAEVVRADGVLSLSVWKVGHKPGDPDTFDASYDAVTGERLSVSKDSPLLTVFPFLKPLTED